MNNNFDLKKYLVENKLTYQEKMKGKAKKLNEVTDQAAAAEKASDKIADDPKIQQSVAQLSPNQINNIRKELEKLGINSNTSAVDIERKIEAQNISENITEGDAKEKIAKVLQDIGAANIAAWGGVPAAIAIGTQTGMPLGFAISWGATTILMGLAKLLDKKGKLNEASNKTMETFENVLNSLKVLEGLIKSEFKPGLHDPSKGIGVQRTKEEFLKNIGDIISEIEFLKGEYGGHIPKGYNIMGSPRLSSLK